MYCSVTHTHVHPITADASDTQELKVLLAQQEQQLRNRNTMLIVPGKNFNGVCTEYISVFVYILPLFTHPHAMHTIHTQQVLTVLHDVAGSKRGASAKPQNGAARV